MGQLGWELCAIDNNNKDDQDRSFYIYKRILPKVIVEDSNTEEVVNNENNWKATIEDIIRRDKLPGKIREYTYMNDDGFTRNLEINFGKNGLGLTSELNTIGSLILDLSKTNIIYIESAFIDTCDDVYTLKFILKPID